MKLKYKRSYTTAGGAVRYDPVGSPKVSLGNLYVRGARKTPAQLTIMVEGLDEV